MGLRVVQHHLHKAGMPATSRGNRPRQKAIAAHDTEGGTGEQAAWNTISWMRATAPQRNASYNEFWAFDEKTDELLAIVVVPASHAAHSVAPQPPLYSPDAKVRQALGASANDPNMWVYAVSIAGRVADVERYARNPAFVAAARQRIEQLNFGPILEHFRFNPRTRSDWGRSLTPAILASPSTEEDPMSFDLARPVAPYLSTIGPGTNVRRAPVLGDPDYTLKENETKELLVIGEIEGDEYPKGSGNRTWKIYQTSEGTQFWVFHSSQEISRKEVAGIPKAAWAALQNQAIGELRQIAQDANAAAGALEAKTPF